MYRDMVLAVALPLTGKGEMIKSGTYRIHVVEPDVRRLPVVRVFQPMLLPASLRHLVSKEFLHYNSIMRRLTEQSRSLQKLRDQRERGCWSPTTPWTRRTLPRPACVTSL